MKNKIKKIVSFIFVFGIVLLVNIAIYATDGSDLVGQFNGTSEDTSEGQGIIEDLIGIVLSAVRIVAAGVALIMLIYLGIKYMSAAPSEKANIKNQLITYVAGAAVVVCTTTILEKIKKFSQNATS